MGGFVPKLHNVYFQMYSKSFSHSLFYLKSNDFLRGVDFKIVKYVPYPLYCFLKKHKLDKSCLFKICLLLYLLTCVTESFTCTCWLAEAFFLIKCKRQDSSRSLYHNSWFLAVEFTEKDLSLYLALQSRKTEAGDNADLTGLNCRSVVELKWKQDYLQHQSGALFSMSLVSCAEGNDTSSFMICHCAYARAHTHTHCR